MDNKKKAKEKTATVEEEKNEKDEELYFVPSQSGKLTEKEIIKLSEIE